MKPFTILLSLFVLCLMTPALLSAQAQTIPASPAKETTGKIGDASMEINYSSRGVKGRTICGELVLYDVILRSGAYAVTTITTDNDRQIYGNKRPHETNSFKRILNQDH